MRRCSLLLSLPALLAIALTIVGQSAIRSLEPGVSVKKTLSATQTHSYTVTVAKDQFVQLTVEQLNIDVVVRVFLPDGTLLREFDSPNGTEGVELVEFVGDSSGNYRVDIVQLAGGDATGQYEIKIEELRRATEQELQSRKNERTRKEKPAPRKRRPPMPWSISSWKTATAWTWSRPCTPSAPKAGWWC